MITFLPAGTPVFSAMGYKPIEDIKPYQQVFDLSGNLHAVTNIIKKEYSGKLVGISCIGGGKRTFLTPDLNVPLYESVNVGGNIEKALNGKSIQTADAASIKQGQFVLLPRFAMFENHTLDAGDYFPQFKTIDESVLRNWAGLTMARFIPLNLAFGKLIGYIVASKTFRDKNEYEFSMPKDNVAVIDDFAELLKSVFAVRVTTATRKNEVKIRFKSSIICYFLSRLFDGNNFPKMIWQSNQEFIRGIIIGLISSKGSYNSSSIGFLSKNRRLILDVKALFLSIGLYAPIKKNNARWAVEVHGDNLSVLYKMCLRNRTPKFDRLYERRHRSKQSSFMYGNFLLSRITRITEINYHGQIYGLETENPTFITAFAGYNRTPQ